MRTKSLLHVAVVAVMVAVASTPALAVDKATSRLEGKVTAKTDSTLTILLSNTKKSTQVTVAGTTKVTGERQAFKDVAVGDTVRIEGQTTGDLMTAERIDVVALASAHVDSKTHTGSGTSGTGADISIGIGTGLDVHLP